MLNPDIMVRIESNGFGGILLRVLVFKNVHLTKH